MNQELFMATMIANPLLTAAECEREYGALYGGPYSAAAAERAWEIDVSQRSYSLDETFDLFV